MSESLYKAFNNNAPEVLKCQYPKFYNQLISTGCIQNDDADETSLLQERINKIDNSGKDYLLTINPTLSCNFKCWYCYEKHPSQSQMNADILERVKKHISLVIQKIQPPTFHLGFFGGEPLLHYSNVVYPILNHLNKECEKYHIKSSIAFTSNGYLLTNKMIDEMAKLKVHSFQITLDGDKESHNQVRYPYQGADSFTRIVENIKTLLKKDIWVVLRINYTAQSLKGTQSISENFKDLTPKEKEKFQVDYQRVWQDRDSYSEDLKALLEECIESFEKKGINVTYSVMNQVWNSCYADKQNQAVINYNGLVYKCTARDFNEKNSLGYLNEEGNIIWNQQKLNYRTNIRLSKQICRNCRIAPLCGGTCAQRILENPNENECTRKLSDEAKDRIVLEHFYYTRVKQG